MLLQLADSGSTGRNMWDAVNTFFLVFGPIAIIIIQKISTKKIVNTQTETADSIVHSQNDVANTIVQKQDEVTNTIVASQAEAAQVVKGHLETKSIETDEKLDKIHELTNSSMTKALDRIAALSAQLEAVGIMPNTKVDPK